MLTKALLTGGMLSVLAGSIVYFGTEGAIADERGEDVRVELDSSELAGGETTVTTNTNVTETTVEKTVEAEDPPKTKWLDQYLKADKAEKEVEQKPEPEMVEETPEADEPQNDDKPMGEKSRNEIIRIMKDASKREITDQDIIDAGRKDGPGSGFLPTEPADGERRFKRGTPEMQDLPFTTADYDRVLKEARKIDIETIRDQAMLEILDHALDRNRTGRAADIVSELSTPELRDTARSRIGVSLARQGETEAAFAVLREVEIEELAAPIRLDIIATLMETRAERMNAGKPVASE